MPESVPSVVKNKKEIISISWIHNETKEDISETNNKAIVSILVKTKNYREGEMVFLDITEKDGGEVHNGRTIITVFGKVKADGSAELKEIFSNTKS